MNTGALIFAFNNKHIDYLAMAAWSTTNIHRHLDIPVCVITDATTIPKHYQFDKVVHLVSTDTQTRHFTDFDITAVWHNGSRTNAYELSPWDKTLVLDADYVVASNQLQSLFKLDKDFISHRMARDVSGYPSFNDNNWFGKIRVPMHWATVMLFTKNSAAKFIFDSMQMIKEHWNHYRNIYNITESTYRNDYALSIAMNMVEGHTLWSTDIPWNLSTITPKSQLTQLDVDMYRVDYTDSQDRPRWVILNQDFHAMGKKALGDIVASNL
jgi:hypothetical protein